MVASAFIRAPRTTAVHLLPVSRPATHLNQDVLHLPMWRLHDFHLSTNCFPNTVTEISTLSEASHKYHGFDTLFRSMDLALNQGDDFWNDFIEDVLDFGISDSQSSSADIQTRVVVKSGDYSRVSIAKTCASRLHTWDKELSTVCSAELSLDLV